MLYSTTTQYAIRGLAELASRGAGRGMMLEALARPAGLPAQFLGKVFQKLVKAGILKSARGRGGGFALARAAHDITLMQIVRATADPADAPDACVLGLEKCNDEAACPLHDLYKPIRQRLTGYLDTTTLADLAASLRSKAAWARAHAPAGEP